MSTPHVLGPGSILCSRIYHWCLRLQRSPNSTFLVMIISPVESPQFFLICIDYLGYSPSAIHLDITKKKFHLYTKRRYRASNPKSSIPMPRSNIPLPKYPNFFYPRVKVYRPLSSDSVSCPSKICCSPGGVPHSMTFRSRHHGS